MLKMKMEMKRMFLKYINPKQRDENRPPMGLQHSTKNLQPEYEGLPLYMYIYCLNCIK